MRPGPHRGRMGVGGGAYRVRYDRAQMQPHAPGRVEHRDGRHRAHRRLARDLDGTFEALVERARGPAATRSPCACSATRTTPRRSPRTRSSGPTGRSAATTRSGSASCGCAPGWRRSSSTCAATASGATRSRPRPLDAARRGRAASPPRATPPTRRTSLAVIADRERLGRAPRRPSPTATASPSCSATSTTCPTPSSPRSSADPRAPSRPRSPRPRDAPRRPRPRHELEELTA